MWLRIVLLAGLAAMGRGQGTHDTLAVLRWPQTVTLATSQPMLRPQDVASLLAQSLGLPSLQPEAPLANSQPFKTPKASIVFVINGCSVGREDVQPAAFWAQLEASNQDDLGSLVTMLTGVDKEAHQLIGRRWLGEAGRVERAFETDDNRPMTGNIADYIEQLFPESLVFSLSADGLLAKGAAPVQPIRAVVHAWDTESQSFETQTESKDPGLARLSTSEIMAELPQTLEHLVPNATLHSADRRLVYGDSEFNLHSDAALRFVGELVATNRLLQLLTREAANGEQPHFAVVTLAGPELVSKAYGQNSQQAKAACAIASEAVKKAALDTDTAYKGNAMVTMIGLESRPDLGTKLRHRRAAAANTTSAQFASSHAATFQIMFWLVFGLIVAVWMTVYLCATMDPGYDSVIYRTTGGAHQKND